jgi:hypothetical protein
MEHQNHLSFDYRGHQLLIFVKCKPLPWPYPGGSCFFSSFLFRASASGTGLSAAISPAGEYFRCYP